MIEIRPVGTANNFDLRLFFMQQDETIILMGTKHKNHDAEIEGRDTFRGWATGWLTPEWIPSLGTGNPDGAIECLFIVTDGGMRGKHLDFKSGKTIANRLDYGTVLPRADTVWFTIPADAKIVRKVEAFETVCKQFNLAPTPDVLAFAKRISGADSSWSLVDQLAKKYVKESK